MQPHQMKPTDTARTSGGGVGMRKRADVIEAIAQLKDARNEAAHTEDVVTACTTTAIIKTLEWILGSDEKDGFGDMISRLKRIDAERNN